MKKAGSRTESEERKRRNLRKDNPWNRQLKEDPIGNGLSGKIWKRRQIMTRKGGSENDAAKELPRGEKRTGQPYVTAGDSFAGLPGEAGADSTKS